MTLSPHAVLFDMDGLLVDTEPLWFVAETRVAGHLGARWSHEHQRAMLGSSLPRTAAHLLDLSGADVPRERVEQALLDEMETLLRNEAAPLRPGAGRLLRRLRRDDVPLGLVSSSYRVLVDAVLSHIGTEHFEVSVAGDEVVHRKPHPEPYLRAAGLLGLPPARCLVLEDSPTGVASATSAGCPVVAVPSLVPVDPAPGVRVLPSLELLADLPGALSGGLDPVAGRPTPDVD